MQHERVTAIVTYLKSRVPFTPDVGIICGSGLGGLADTLKQPLVIHYSDIPQFPQTTVHGHAGDLVFGELGGKKVVCMKGRFHYYEGNSPATTGLPVRVMAALGVRVLIVTNAAGGVNPAYNVCDVMLLSDHIAFMGLAGLHPLVGDNDARFGPRFPAVGTAYDSRLRSTMKACAAKLKFPLREGIYAGVSGPSYEAPAEISMIRTVGGDAVGMSTVFEVLTAAHASLPVLGFSLITNKCLATGDNGAQPNHAEVLEAVAATGTKLQDLVESFLRALKVEDFPTTPAYEHFKGGPKPKAKL